MKISEIPLLFLSQIMLYMTCNSNTFRHIESKYKKKKKNGPVKIISMYIIQCI